VATFSLLIYIGLGDKTTAIQYLERCSQDRENIDLDWIKVDPLLDPLRGIRGSMRWCKSCSRTVKLDNFFAELKRRNVYKVAVAYAVVAWLLIQVATQVFPFSKFRIGRSAGRAGSDRWNFRSRWSSHGRSS